MFLSNLIFRFKIKRKARREYSEESGRMFKREDLEACYNPVSTPQPTDFDYDSYLEALVECMNDTLKLLYGDLPTKEETPDFIDKLDEELRRK